MGNVASQVFVGPEGQVYGRLVDCPAGVFVQERYVTKTWFGGWQLLPVGDEWRYIPLVHSGPPPHDLPGRVVVDQRGVGVSGPVQRMSSARSRS